MTKKKEKGRESFERERAARKKAKESKVVQLEASREPLAHALV